jgi:Protein of unknown function (DUF2442)
MIASHTIQEILFGPTTISLIIDGKQIKMNLEDVSEKLNKATDLQRNFYKISPSGYGIHWPLIDEDLSVAALLKLSNNS